jgi:hypothetical protein
LVVTPSKQLFYCFSAGIGGDPSVCGATSKNVRALTPAVKLLTLSE